MKPDTANTGGAVFLLALIILSIFAIAGAKGLKWKLLNLLIIVGFMAGGLTIGLAVGGDSATGGHLAAALMPPLGAVGAFACLRRNKRRISP